MTDRPIIFSAPMVRALLAGRKTQTRRIVQMGDWGPYDINGVRWWRIGNSKPVIVISDEQMIKGKTVAKRFAVGDRLWVREAGDLLTAAVSHNGRVDIWSPVGWRHEADSAIIALKDAGDVDSYIGDCSIARRPSIFMPRWASRLMLTITSVKIERLQDISEADAIAEGIKGDSQIVDVQCYGGKPVERSEWRYFRDGMVPMADGFESAGEAYFDLWDDLHGKGAAEANPWVVAVSFDVKKENIDGQG